jgi:hypothetical protein
MGFIRGGLLTIVCILLFISLLAGGVFLTFSNSLAYENVRPEISAIVEDIIQEEIGLKGGLEDEFALMQEYCENDSGSVLLEEGYTVEIPCEVVSQGLDSVINYSVNTLIEEAYYKDYECSFWDCLKEEGIPLFLVSAKAKSYWHSRFYFTLIASLILAFLAFLLIEKKTSFPILLGVFVIVSSLPLLKIEWVGSLFGDTFGGVVSVFFSQAHSVFWTMLVIGIVLIVLGILLKIFLFDFIKRKFSKEEVKDIIQKEVSKAKVEVKKTKPAAKPGKSLEKPKKKQMKKGK